jgi:hypothetical protein
MKPANNTSGPSDPIVHRLQLAQREEASAAQTCALATSDLATAEAAYLASGSIKDEDTVSRCRMRLGRAEKLHATACTTLDAAWSAVRARDHERLQQAHKEDLISLPHFIGSLDPLAERLAQIDRAAYTLVTEIADAVMKGAAAWEAAATRAASVGSNLGSIPKPSLADVLLYLQTRTSETRDTEAREDCSELLAEPIGFRDWRTADSTAAERAGLAVSS